MKKKNKTTKKTAVFMSWFIYIIIFFEMLYMATPFAVFFYSVYGAPLKFLNSNQSTFWLIQPILPHFSQTNDLLINTLLFISWPLMLIGLIVFFIGFFQIYWAKFTKKGAVLGGIYKFIRHPQYAAWSIFGLGMAMFWSRMIVWLMFITMLFVYYLLAKSEERECLEKYGDNYNSYMKNTGMFFPKILNKGKSWIIVKLPESRIIKVFTVILIYIVLITSTIGLGNLLKNYSINKLSTYSENNFTALSTTVMNETNIKSLIDAVLKNKNVQTKLSKVINLNNDKLLIYILPFSWSVSELGIETSELYESHSRQNISSNPIAHGNVIDKNEIEKKIIFSYAATKKNAQGLNILKQCRSQIPKLIVTINLKTNEIGKIIKPPLVGRYKDIPVPMF